MDSLHQPFHFLTSVIPSVYGPEVSLKSFVSIKLSFQTDTIIHNHFPQWNYIPLAESDPFPQRIWASRYSFSSQSNHLCRLAFIIASWAFHSILGQKWHTLYLSLFDPSNQRFHLQVSERRNLNRAICHTPIFDLRP